MLTRSVDDKMITNMLPKTFKAMKNWDEQELPSEEVFASFLADYRILIESKNSRKTCSKIE